MSRKKDRTLWQHRFNLSSDDPAQKRLHEKLEELALTDEAGDFMRAALLEYLDKRTAPLYQGSTTVVPGLQESTEQDDPVQEPPKAEPAKRKPKEVATRTSSSVREVALTGNISLKDVSKIPSHILAAQEQAQQKVAQRVVGQPQRKLGAVIGGVSGANGHREDGE